MKQWGVLTGGDTPASVEIGVSPGEAVGCALHPRSSGQSNTEIGMSGGEAVGCALQARTSRQLVLTLAGDTPHCFTPAPPASVEIGVSGGEAHPTASPPLTPASVEIGVSGGEAVGCAYRRGHRVS